MLVRAQRATTPRIEYLRPPALEGVELVTIEGADASAEPWMVPELLLALVGEGKALLVRAPGRLGQVRRLCRPFERLPVALIDPRVLRRALPGAGSDDHWLAGGVGDLISAAPPFLDAYHALWRAVDGGACTLDQQGRLQRLLHVLANDVLPRPPIAPRTMPRSLRRIREILHDRYADGVSLDELGRIAGMSKFHVLRLFHREMGLPPYAYQIHLRVSRARALISAGMSLGEVAGETGFADQSHLTRVFKRIVGVSPGQYARGRQRR